MAQHIHDFVETYRGPVAFGLDRPTNEHTVIWYLQKFCDDHLIQKLVQRMGDEELEEVFNLISRLLKAHLTEPEYHRLFLKDHNK